MKKIIISAIFIAAIALIIYAISTSGFFYRPLCVNSTDIRTVFSPGAQNEILGLVADSRESLYVEIFEFNYEPLKEALVEAEARGVDVKVILEPSVYQNKGTYNYLQEAEVEVKWLRSFNIVHSKFMIVDGQIVLVGSINWSKTAMEKNREAGVVIQSGAVAASFRDVFDYDWQLAK
jgi:phosphatidylserine/phosphatidylglycerophosphate/cardiolipin synthase-like enzyme